jgi:hypothetical protein
VLEHVFAGLREPTGRAVSELMSTRQNAPVPSDDTAHLDLVKMRRNCRPEECELAASGATREDLHVNAERRFAGLAQRVEAAVAQFQAQLVFALRMEGAVAFMTSCAGRAPRLFSGVNPGMDLERDHKISPRRKGHVRCQDLGCGWIEAKRLISRRIEPLSNFAQDPCGNLSQSKADRCRLPAKRASEHVVACSPGSKLDQAARCNCSPRNPFTE